MTPSKLLRTAVIDVVVSPNVDRAPSVQVQLEPLLVTVEETCKLLNCGRTTVFNLLAIGVLDRRKVGRATRITMRSIRKLAGA